MWFVAIYENSEFFSVTQVFGFAADQYSHEDNVFVYLLIFKPTFLLERVKGIAAAQRYRGT